MGLYRTKTLLELGGGALRRVMRELGSSRRGAASVVRGTGVDAAVAQPAVSAAGVTRL